MHAMSTIKGLQVLFVYTCGMVALVTIVLTIAVSFAPKHEYTPYYNRSFSFTREELAINLEGPTVNSLSSKVRWLEDLSHGGPVCSETEPFILAVVPSAVQNFGPRQRVRDTWADPKLFPYTGLRAVFVLGSTTNQTLQKQVKAEMQLHGDILQYDFVDSYRTLTYKTISWLSWLRGRCLNTPYIAKIDDDVLVNPFNLYRFLEMKFNMSSGARVIYGRLRKKKKPHRRGKWNVTQQEFSGIHYPSFVLGSAYILGRNAIEVLLEFASYTPFLWLEDVYITGLVAEAAGVKREQTESLLFSESHTKYLYKGDLAFYVGGSASRMKNGWYFILKNSYCCSNMD